MAAAYLAFGVAWILGSDRIIEALADDASVLSQLQSAKGVLFVALSSLVLYFAVRLVVDANAAARGAEAGDGHERLPLRVQLLLLVAATALPLIALLAYNVQREATRDQESAGRTAADVARVIATDAARIVLDTRQIAEALAQRPLVRALDPARCDAQLAQLVKLLPYIANVATMSGDGSVVCTAMPLPEPAVSFAASPEFQHAVRSGNASVGRLVRGRISGRWIVPVIAVIVDDRGAAIGAISMALDAARLSLVAAAAAPEPAMIALLDRTGTIVMRLPERDRIGADASDSPIARIALAGGNGHARARGRTGDDQIFGYARVEGADWTAIVATPARVALAASREAAARSSIFAALMLLAAGIAAYVAARGIERPMRAIAHAARRVAEGDLSARAPVAGSDETAHVAGQLNRLLERLPRIESRLRESERRLELVLASAQEGILVTDAGGEIRFANDAAAKLLGCGDPAELVGRASDEALPEAFAEDARRRLDERRAGRRDRYEIRIRAQDGAVRWLFVSATPLVSDGGAFEGVLAMLYDVTERKEVEERLARMTKLYWALTAVNEAIVRTTDRATLLEEACRIVVREGGFVSAFVTLLDRARTALVPVASAGAADGPLGVDALSLEAGAPFADGVLACAVRSGQKEVVNDSFADARTGPAHPLARSLGIRSFAVFPLRCEGQVAGALAVYASDVDYFDIGLAELLGQVADDLSFALEYYERAAARKRAESAVLELNAELERRVAERTARLTEANRELEAFAYSVSHDLRAPVRAIHGSAEHLSTRAGATLDDEGQRLLAGILRSSAHMSRLIDDLLAFAQLGWRTIDLAPVELSPIVARIADELRPALDETAATVDIATDLPGVLGEPTLLAQLFVNLVSNAVEHRRPGVPPRIAVSGMRDGERVEIRVADNGVGIAPQDRKRIFEMFVRLPTPCSRPGTGMGLALAAKAAGLMRGEIDVESTAGNGATFRVTLPAPRDRDVPAASAWLA